MSNYIANERRKAIRAIKRIVEPHFHDSGYRTAVVPGTPIGHPSGRRPVRMWTVPGKPVGWVELRGGFVLTGFAAITEFGPMLDAHGGGMTWASYGSFPLEDLLKLRAWAERTFVAQKVAA